MVVVEKLETESFEIRGAPALDPIQIHVQDLGSRRGRITITCFGSAWTAYWNAMPVNTTAEFAGTMGADYLCNALAPPSNQTKSQEKYRLRIAEMVKQFFAARLIGREIAARDSGEIVTDSPEPMSYIGRAPCGCIRFAAVDEPAFAKETAQAVARIIEDGGTVERVTCQYVRENMKRCPRGKGSDA